MLVLAIPKSASTSLMKTLAQRHSLPGKQVMFPENDVPDAYPVLGAWHSDVRTLNTDDVSGLRGSGFFKQHIPPTEHNTALLTEFPKVLLLRDPSEIVRAYRRAEVKGVHASRPEFDGCESEDDWLQRAEEIGLIRELTNWTEGWTARVKAERVIQYEELMTSPDAVVRRVERSFELTSSAEPVSLVRARYSRDSASDGALASVKSAVRWLRRRARRMLG